MKYILTLSCLVLGLNSQVSLAAESAGINDVAKLNVSVALEKISKQINKKLTVSNVQTTPIPGLYEVTVDTNIFYIYGDRYVIAGELLDVTKDKNSWSNTEQSLRKIRKDLIATVDPKDMIIFPAKKPQIASVVVFTDIDCTYCHKLQANIKQYTDLGIEIRYLAFPRSGPNTESFFKAVTVWCSKDRQKALTDSMQGTDLATNQCAKNPITKQFELGMKVGVTGTPTMILESGAKIPGLASAEELAKLIVKYQAN